MEGKTLADLRLPGKYGVKLVEVMRAGAKSPSRPDPKTPFSAGDRFLCMGSSDSIESLARKFALSAEP